MNKGKFIVLSDFHSIKWPLYEKIEGKYLNNNLYDKVYILGDITDRGEDGLGTDGVKMLLDIMDLSKKDDRIVYIPGNHDEILYNYINSGQSFYYGTQNMYINTQKDLDELKQNNPEKFKELNNWLGSLPIQRMHEYKGKKYALSHALFDYDLYKNNQNVSLKDFYNVDSSNDLYYRIRNILWFRKYNRSTWDTRYDDGYNPSYLPPKDVTCIIGHTPHTDEKNATVDYLLNDKDEKIKQICVDSGISYISNTKQMSVFDPDRPIEESRTVSGVDNTKQNKDYKKDLDDILKDMIFKYQDYTIAKEQFREFINTGRYELITRTNNCRNRMQYLVNKIGYNAIIVIVNSNGGLDTYLYNLYQDLKYELEHPQRREKVYAQTNTSKDDTIDLNKEGDFSTSSRKNEFFEHKVSHTTKKEDRSKKEEEINKLLKQKDLLKQFLEINIVSEEQAEEFKKIYQMLSDDLDNLDEKTNLEIAKYIIKYSINEEEKSYGK